MLSMNNYDLLDHFLCIHLIIVVSSCKYGSWHMIFFNILFHFVNVGTPFCLAGGGGGGGACYRLDLGCKRSKKDMLLFHYVIYSPLS